VAIWGFSLGAGSLVPTKGQGQVGAIMLLTEVGTVVETVVEELKGVLAYGS